MIPYIYFKYVNITLKLLFKETFLKYLNYILSINLKNLK